MTTGIETRQMDANDVWVAINHLQGSMADLASSMKALEGRMSGLEARMTGVEAQVSGLAASHHELTQRVDKLFISIIGAGAVGTASLVGASVAFAIAG